jgi:hypothetical protein
MTPSTILMMTVFGLLAVAVDFGLIFMLGAALT